jgi:hypothetical protein
MAEEDRELTLVLGFIGYIGFIGGIRISKEDRVIRI